MRLTILTLAHDLHFGMRGEAALERGNGGKRSTGQQDGDRRRDQQF